MDYVTGKFINHKCGIYLVENPLGEVYIGASRDIPQRIRDYKRASSASGNLKLSIFKHGRRSHKYYLLLKFDEYVNDQTLNYFEKVYIRKYMREGYSVMNKLIGNYGDRSKLKGVFSVRHKGFYIDPCAIPS